MKIDKYYHLWTDKSTVYFDEVEPLESRPKGKYIYGRGVYKIKQCSICGKYRPNLWGINYCFNCGAQMEGE